MLVNYQGQTLWIEGDKAYSVDNIKNKHTELTNKRSKLDSDIVDYVNVINKTIRLKESAELEKSKVISELEGIDYILNRIKVAESSELGQELPTEVVDSTKLSPECEVVNTEVEVDGQEFEEVVSDNEDDAINDNGGFFRRRR